MRRKEKEITDKAEIEAVIAEAPVCRLAMCDDDSPYVVPMSFGYADGAFYFHGAPEGRKIGILERNDRVCIELEAGVGLKPAEKACKWGIAFRSVIAFGRASFVESAADRRSALNIIMGHYSAGDFDYDEAVLAKTRIIRVEVTEMTGKKSA
jgi:nitroimidazol reductase NimA-like FMN-containing flavoprotein (pyridoxamine 5'-phosphate oxidase superfamily)